MRLSEAFDIYEKSIETATAREHGGKIKKYISYVGNLYINDEKAFSDKNLKNFIYDGIHKALGKYSALRSFYDFTKIKIENQPKNTVNFPIDRNDVIAFDIENSDLDESAMKEKGAVYLEKKFDFSQLFNDSYYEHLNNDIAVKIIKASISLGLAAGYDSGEMFFTSRKPAKFTLNDIELNDNMVRVRNFNNSSMNEWITIIGYYAKYIIDYYELRIRYNAIPEKEKDIFFTMIYDTYKLDYDTTIQDRKPYTVQLLVLYFLKYISKSLNLERELNVKDLKCNMVLHSLYKSQGASLHQIIRSFGYPPFVQNAFERYCNDNLCNGLNILFEDNHFFYSAPLEEANLLDIDSGGDNKAKQYLINRQIRDSKAVKILKMEYNNICQICGEPLVPIEELSYSECCHIHPLWDGGIDDKTNMLILCPNHHTLFDLGVIAISPEDLTTIIHVDGNNHLCGSKLRIVRHKISSTNVRYHYENIFLSLLRSLKK